MTKNKINEVARDKISVDNEVKMLQQQGEKDKIQFANAMEDLKTEL